MPAARATAAFDYPDVRRFFLARLLSTLALQMTTVAVGWLAYELTRDPLVLGLVGLLQFLPSVVLMLVTGHVADRFDRRAVVVVCLVGLAGAAVLLAAGAHHIGFIYVAAVVIGSLRAFIGPAMQATLPRLLPAEHFGNAVSWNIVIFQMGMTVGPAVGGLVYGFSGPRLVFALAAVGWILAAVLTLMLKTPVRPEAPPDARWQAVLAGVRYVWRERPLFAAISLDLVAVLLGGAVALLPIFASDYLKIGPMGLGVLRAAPAVGSGLAALVLTRHPFERRLGPKMLAGVFVFGLATIVFGASESFALSLAALLTVGAADMASLQVRQMLVQLSTPDSMRGRVNAVNSVFVGASNELGEFESGVTAAWMGARLAVMVGGAGACLAAIVWTRLFPQLLAVDRLRPVA